MVDRGVFLYAQSNDSPRGAVPVGQKDAADAAAARIAKKAGSRIVRVRTDVPASFGLRRRGPR